jgi:hypothetical protein
MCVTSQRKQRQIFASIGASRHHLPARERIAKLASAILTRHSGESRVYRVVVRRPGAIDARRRIFRDKARRCRELLRVAIETAPSRAESIPLRYFLLLSPPPADTDDPSSLRSALRLEQTFGCARAIAAMSGAWNPAAFMCPMQRIRMGCQFDQRDKSQRRDRLGRLHRFQACSGVRKAPR